MTAHSIATTLTPSIDSTEEYNQQRVDDLLRRIYLFERTTWDTDKTQDFRDALAREYAKPGNPNPDAVVPEPRRYRTRDFTFDEYPPKSKKDDSNNNDKNNKEDEHDKKSVINWLNSLGGSSK